MVGGIPQRKLTLKPAKIPCITMWQYWLGNTDYAQKSFQIDPTKSCYRIFKKKLFI